MLAQFPLHCPRSHPDATKSTSHRGQIVPGNTIWKVANSAGPYTHTIYIGDLYWQLLATRPKSGAAPPAHPDGIWRTVRCDRAMSAAPFAIKLRSPRINLSLPTQTLPPLTPFAYG
jgi:hypothetical protein